MKTNRMAYVAAARWLVAAVATFAASAHLGSWKLNESKSKLSIGAKNTSVTYTEGKSGKMMLTVEGVDKDGKPVEWTGEGKFDGKPHKMKGSEVGDKMAVKTVDDRTNELTIMKGGKVVMTGTVTVAKDGKSRMVNTTMTDTEGKNKLTKPITTKGSLSAVSS